MALKTITINVNDGNFTYSELVAYVDPGDDIEWICENEYDFAIHLSRCSPLNKGRFRGKKIIKANVEKDAKRGIYKYFVAVYYGEEIWTDDPVLIVPRPG